MDGAAQKQETQVGNLWQVEKQGWDGWVHAASDLMIRTKITTRTVWKRKKNKKSAARQILKD
jgi:hypothetical protein